MHLNISLLKNCGNLSKEMGTYYRSAIIEYCNAANDYPKMQEFFKTISGIQFSELKKPRGKKKMPIKR
ncbi:MAG: hypothetical protein WCC06_04890 [Candidatus Aminicenantales bacterium]